jgi:hypothetical protein
MAIEVAYVNGAYKVKRTKLKFPGSTFTCTTPGETIGPTIPRTFKTAVKFSQARCRRDAATTSDRRRRRLGGAQPSSPSSP